MDIELRWRLLAEGEPVPPGAIWLSVDRLCVLEYRCRMPRHPGFIHGESDWFPWVPVHFHEGP